MGPEGGFLGSEKGTEGASPRLLLCLLSFLKSGDQTGICCLRTRLTRPRGAGGAGGPTLRFGLSSGEREGVSVQTRAARQPRRCSLCLISLLDLTAEGGSPGRGFGEGAQCHCRSVPATRTPSPQKRPSVPCRVRECGSPREQGRGSVYTDLIKHGRSPRSRASLGWGSRGRGRGDDCHRHGDWCAAETGVPGPGRASAAVGLSPSTHGAPCAAPGARAGGVVPNPGPAQEPRTGQTDLLGVEAGPGNATWGRPGVHLPERPAPARLSPRPAASSPGELG